MALVWIHRCWQIKIREVLDIKREPQNEQDKNAIAVIKDGEVVSHIPKGLASTKQGTAIVKHFLTKAGLKCCQSWWWIWYGNPVRL